MARQARSKGNREGLIVSMNRQVAVVRELEQPACTVGIDDACSERGPDRMFRRHHIHSVVFTKDVLSSLPDRFERILKAKDRSISLEARQRSPCELLEGRECRVGDR